MSKRELPAAFVSADVEGSLYDKWIAAGYFTPTLDAEKTPYTIVIPPPNVNGSLHIGHALDHTIQDILIRMKRMKGFDALWLPGMDHAGIAMQNVVESTSWLDARVAMAVAFCSLFWMSIVVFASRVKQLDECLQLLGKATISLTNLVGWRAADRFSSRA